ncbi:conserved hypothetical protein [Salinibacter ruber M8]|uniref:PIN domain-containing protein n=1 Tax=Salinibacter ruber (strain M8) TaxID=761659 RepID=D5H6S0_SALRM|nr:conserved hypothetical protein [Salinibacter ruber M8]
MHRLPEELGDGEREALALAVERDANLVVLNDQEGRRVAKQRGLSVTGTIGVLVEARAAEHADSLRGELDRVLEAGLWISESFLRAPSARIWGVVISITASVIAACR